MRSRRAGSGRRWWSRRPRRRSCWRSSAVIDVGAASVVAPVTVLLPKSRSSSLAVASSELALIAPRLRSPLAFRVTGARAFVTETGPVNALEAFSDTGPLAVIMVDPLTLSAALWPTLAPAVSARFPLGIHARERDRVGVGEQDSARSAGDGQLAEVVAGRGQDDRREPRLQARQAGVRRSCREALSVMPWLMLIVRPAAPLVDVIGALMAKLPCRRSSASSPSTR